MAQYSVEAVLKATGVNDFVNTIKKAEDSVKSLETGGKRVSASLGSILKAVGITKAISVGFDMMKNSVEGAVERFDTLNNFPKVMEKIGFTTDQSSRAINRLSEGTDGLPTTLDSIAKTTQRIASMTGDLDGAVETSLALNNAFIASGASTADATRGLDQYVQMLAKGEVDLQSWRTLQETMPYALQETAKAFGFTGKSAQNDFYDALKSGEITMDEMNDKLIELSGGVGGFAEVAREATGGIGTAWSRLETAVSRNVEKIIRTIDDLLAENGLPTFEQMIDAVRGQVDKWFGAVASVLPQIVAMFKSFANVLEPFAPILSVVGSAVLVFVGIIGGLSIAITHLLPSVESLKMVFSFLFNPITLIIGAVSALIGAFIYFYQTNEEVREAVDNAWSQIKELIAPVVESIVETVKGLWGGFVAWWEENNEKIKDSLVDGFVNAIENVVTIIEAGIAVIKGIWNGFKAFWEEYGETIIQVGKKAWELYSTAVETIIQTIVEIIMMLWNNFTNFWEEYGEQITTIAQTAWETIKMIITTIVEVIVGIAIATWTVFQEFWDEHGEYITEVATFIWETVKEIVTTVIEAILEVVQTFLDMFNDFWEAHGETITSIAIMAWGIVVGVITEFVAIVVPILEGFFEFIKTAWDFLVPIVQEVWDLIKVVIEIALELIGMIIELFMAIIHGDWEQAWEIIKETTSNIWDIIVEYISEKLQAIVQWISDKLSEAAAYVQEKWEIAKTHTLVIWEAIKQWVRNKAQEIVQSVQQKFQEVVQNVQNKFNTALQLATQIWQSIKDTIFNKAVEIVNDVRNKFTEVKQQIQNKMTEAKEVVSNKVGEMVSAVKNKAGEMVSAGADLIRGLIQGIKEMASDAVEAAKGVVRSAIDGAKSLLGINSPSRVFMEIGAFTSEGLAIGIDKDAPKAVKSVENMASDLTNAFSPDLDYNSSLNNQLSNAKVTSVFDHNVSLSDSIDNNIVVHTKMEINGAEYKSFVSDIAREINRQDNQRNSFSY